MNKEEFYSNAIDLSNENEVNNLIIKNQERTITKLKEENERLSVELNTCMIERNNYLSKIDKAIEYIKINGEVIDIYEPEIIINKCKLLSILRGENNEQ